MAEAVIKLEKPNEEESFIILGTSPGSSLDLKYNGGVAGNSINEKHLEEALKDMSIEANLAFKAHFHLGDNPSPNSMMVASTIASGEKSTEEIQKKIGELLDENVLLKDTLKQNNESMKEQLLMIASCQEDVLNTHKANKEKFEETKDLIEKLRKENKVLKLEISKQSASSSPHKSLSDQSSDVSEQAKTSHTSSVYEFVTSPDDDTINKLTAQLELVEKQRRQVIVDNEKLTWQKESLEHIIDATTKERDDVKQKLLNAELQQSIKESNFIEEKKNTEVIIKDLKVKLASYAEFDAASFEDVQKKNIIIKELDQKMLTLQNELKTTQLKLLESEGVKLQYSKLKSVANETLKIYQEQVKDLQDRLKEAHTTVFQPVRFSLFQNEETTGTAYSGLIYHVQLYEKAVKQLSEILNSITNGTFNGISKTMDLVVKAQEMKLEKVDKVKDGLEEIRLGMEQHNAETISNISKIRSTLAVFESIFKDYKAILKEAPSLTEKSAPESNHAALTSALVARAEEVDALKNEVKSLRLQTSDSNAEYIDLLKAQIDIYKTDFEAERDARQKMASEKESALVDLRNTHRRNQQLVEELEEIRRLNPNLLTTKSKPGLRPAPRTPSSSSTNSSSGQAVNKMVCPKCMKFASTDYKKMDDHFDFCFDDF